MTNLSVRELTDKQRAFLSYLADEAQGDIRTAMKLAGYSDNTRQDEVYKGLTDEILAIAKDLLVRTSVKATIKLSNVLDRPGDIGQDKVIAAAKEILDRAGVVKKEQLQQAVTTDQVIFILPPKDQPHTIEGEVIPTKVRIAQPKESSYEGA